MLVCSKHFYIIIRNKENFCVKFFTRNDLCNSLRKLVTIKTRISAIVRTSRKHYNKKKKREIKSENPLKIVLIIKEHMSDLTCF